MSEHSLIDLLNSRASSTEQSRQYSEQRFLHQVQAIKDDPEHLTLLDFLRVLLWHHSLAEDFGAEQTARKRAAYLKKQVALEEVMKALATHKTPKVPSILKGMFEIQALRRAVADHQAEVTAANKANKKRNPTCPRVRPNWRASAAACLLQKSSGEQVYHWPATPWERVVGKLIGMSGIDERFIREWIASEAEFSEPDERAVKLARLDSEGIQWNLLADLRAKFPQEAEDWFGDRQQSRRSRKKRGRPRSSNPDKDKRLVENWKAAKRAGARREGFCREHTIRVQELIQAQDRVRYHQRVGAE